MIKSRREVSIRRSAFAEVTEDSKTLLPHVRLSLFYPSLSLSLSSFTLARRIGCYYERGVIAMQGLVYGHPFIVGERHSVCAVQWRAAIIIRSCEALMHAAIFKERTQPPTCYLTSGFHSVLYLNETFLPPPSPPPPGVGYKQTERLQNEEEDPFMRNALSTTGWMHVKFRFFLWRIEFRFYR